MIIAKTLARCWRVFLSRWGAGLREFLIIASIYGAYRLASNALSHKQLLAFHNSYDIVNAERTLGIFVERDFQSLFLGSSFLIQLANVLYTICYYPALILFAVWAFSRHRELYYTVRNVFVVSACIAFICFALYPTAPPRMLAELGFVDTMSRYGTVDYESEGIRSLANPYAAMPSLHMGWTLLIGVATVYIARFWWLKLIGVMVPFSMLVAIVATGNHFLLDAIAGAAVIVVAYGLVMLFRRWREERLSVLGLKKTLLRNGGG